VLYFLKLYMIKAMSKGIGLGVAGLTVLAMTGITISGGIVQIDPVTDVARVTDATGNFLTSAFEITQFIPVIALLAGGMYVLNKVFSFVPSSGGSN
jgi:hypothetical protein